MPTPVQASRLEGPKTVCMLHEIAPGKLLGTASLWSVC